jgi:hypothetical protein
MHSEGRQVITVQLEIIIGAIRRVLANEFSGPRKNLKWVVIVVNNDNVAQQSQTK